jgi:hypothetical protein
MYATHVTFECSLSKGGPCVQDPVAHCLKLGRGIRLCPDVLGAMRGADSEKKFSRSMSFSALAPAERRRSKPDSTRASAKERVPKWHSAAEQHTSCRDALPHCGSLTAAAALFVLPGPSFCSTGPLEEPRISAVPFFFLEPGFAKLPRQSDWSSLRLSVWNTTRCIEPHEQMRLSSPTLQFAVHAMQY